VRGGGSVVAVFSRRGRVRLVVSTAPGHRLGRLRPGLRVRPGRRVRGRGVVTVRRGRVRLVGVAAR
jgi:hypothetical protein